MISIQNILLLDIPEGTTLCNYHLVLFEAVISQALASIKPPITNPVGFRKSFNRSTKFRFSAIFQRKLHFPPW